MPADSSFASVDHYLGATGQNLLPTGGISTLAQGVTLVNLTTGALNIINGLTLGYRFAILAIQAVVGTPGTGSGATQAISLAISGVAVTGGVLTATLANTATFGTVLAGTPITALNVGGATDTLSIVTAAGGTAFTAGGIEIQLTIQNLDA